MINDKDYIIYKKYISDLFTAAKAKSKSDCCFVCGKKITTTAKSHTLPQFILREIDDNGLVCKNFFVSENINNSFGKDIGIQRASIFRILCDECEHKLFSFYEDKLPIVSLMNNLDKKLFTAEDEIKLASIFLKSTLREIYIKTVADRNIMTDLLDHQVDLGTLSGHNMREINDLNIKDYKIAVNKSLDIIFKQSRNNFYVYYHKTLNYQVQLATQAIVCVNSDFFGNVVNDIEDLSENVKIDDICIVIFPFDKRTHIIIFGLSEGKERYKLFFKELKAMTENERLKAIQALIFSYAEEIYINPKIYDLMEKDEQIKELSCQGVIPTPFIKNNKIFLSLASNNIEGYKNIKECYLTNKYAKH